MKRLLGENWKRVGLQVGLLTGIGLAFAIGAQPDDVNAGPMPDCPSEGECTFKKPNIMFIVDYSTSMNTIWDEDMNLSRWDVTVAAVQTVVQPGSFLSQNTHIALMRFGHDPNGSNNPGGMIDADNSGLVDGQALDVAWDDDANEYFPCNGAAVVDALTDAGAPAGGNMFGIGTWTKGALDATAVEIAQTKADHPEDVNPDRAYVNVLLTDGEWTGVDGTTPLSPDSQNPAITTADLFDNQNIQTFVVALAGDADAETAADETAAAGGTTEAIDGDTPELLAQALGNVVQNIIDSVVAPECIGGLPRVMVLLDGSSSMLNTDMGAAPAPQGTSGWDLARNALTGDNSLFDLDVGVGSVEDVTQLGLSTFGFNQPELSGVEPNNVGTNTGEARVLVQYGPCGEDNFGWALDPNTSCVEPGCDDPWGGPPITWTFQDGTNDDMDDPPGPGFDLPTVSHMPQCGGFQGQGCSGSGTYTHLGLQLIKENQAQYAIDAAQPMAPFPANDETIYFNIMITDGQYNGYSTNAQVQGELEDMYNDGITTYVIGFGDGVDSPQAITQLQNMAEWGSGAMSDYFDANDQAELEAALASIFMALEFDPCCAFNDCSENPEPTTIEPDPLPDPTTTGDGDGDMTGDGDGDPTTTGDGDGDPTTTTGDGDGDPATGDGDGDPATGDGDGDPTTTTTGDTDTDTDTATDSDGETGETGAGAGEIGEDDGCNCSTDDDVDSKRGLLGTLFAFGIAGLVRRRRRD